jgi:putative transposase
VPRRPRSELPEVGAYHVASRGTNHGDIYLDDADRKSFMTERLRLSRGMQVLNGRYAQLFNQRHDRDGHLFRARYSVYVIDDEAGLEASCIYVLENPVRAGLCEKPSEWPWSGCPALSGA